MCLVFCELLLLFVVCEGRELSELRARASEVDVWINNARGGRLAWVEGVGMRQSHYYYYDYYYYYYYYY
eukprot:16432240-Heterocapsa_arctica.AAC.1